MRNPITATADRPIPLPDRVLSDAWWLIRRAAPIVEGKRLWMVASKEGGRERDRSKGRAELSRVGT
jgi:hypothetical protein